MGLLSRYDSEEPDPEDPDPEDSLVFVSDEDNWDDWWEPLTSRQRREAGYDDDITWGTTGGEERKVFAREVSPAPEGPKTPRRKGKGPEGTRELFPEW